MQGGHLMRRHRCRLVGGGVLTWLILISMSANTAWGYFFDERREMSLSGIFYTRGTFSTTSDHIGTGKGLYNAGNLVQHRNFLSLEWRHNINRLTRQAPTLGAAF